MSAITKIPDILVADNEADVRQCLMAFRELRPHLQSEDEFIKRWRRQVAEGYRIVNTSKKEARS